MEPARDIDDESGNVLLYLAVLLPFVLTLSILAIDVSRFQLLREQAQYEADRIALLAAAALPDTDRAAAVARSAAAQLSGLQLARDHSGRALLEVERSRVALTLEGAVSAGFDSFLQTAGGRRLLFRVQERSEAAPAPAEHVLVVSDARTMRPKAREHWGEEQLWPASRYFDFVRAPKIMGELTGQPATSHDDVQWAGWWQAWSTGYQRWATQSCYNPALSALKLTAVSVADMLGARGDNRLGVIYTPAEDLRIGFAVLRPLWFLSGELQSQARWLDYFEAASYLGDEACALFADEAVSNDPRYRLPPPPRFVPQPPQCAARFARSGWGELYFPHGLITSCAAEEALPLRDAIYFHAARANAHLPAAQNVIAALEQAYLQLTVRSGEHAAALAKRLGNLASAPGRYIILLSDALPASDSAEMQQLLERLEAAEITLVAVAFAHEFLDEEHRRTLLARAGALSRRQSKLVRVLPALSSRELTDEVLPRLLSLGARYVIRS